eukprot:scaffold389_cov382-Prasinococcus_capsulatus_cf.AAC.4
MELRENWAEVCVGVGSVIFHVNRIVLIFASTGAEWRHDKFKCNPECGVQGLHSYQLLRDGGVCARPATLTHSAYRVTVIPES